MIPAEVEGRTVTFQVFIASVSASTLFTSSRSLACLLFFTGPLAWRTFSRIACLCRSEADNPFFFVKFRRGREASRLAWFNMGMCSLSALLCNRAFIVFLMMSSS